MLELHKTQRTQNSKLVRDIAQNTEFMVLNRLDSATHHFKNPIRETSGGESWRSNYSVWPYWEGTGTQVSSALSLEQMNFRNTQRRTKTEGKSMHNQVDLIKSWSECICCFSGYGMSY